MDSFIGTVVKLKSGGPEMTVIGPVRDDGLISVAWFCGTELKRDALIENLFIASLQRTKTRQKALMQLLPTNS